jgi:hypothetical protein
LSHNVILGQDFLRSSGAIIDCANHSISLFDGLVNASLTNQRDRTTTLQLAKSVIIPPQTQAALRLLVPPRFQNKTSLLETYEPIKNQFLMVAGALIHPTNHLTVCCVVNAGLKPQKLRKYTPIARISSIDLDDRTIRLCAHSIYVTQFKTAFQASKPVYYHMSRDGNA